MPRRIKFGKGQLSIAFGSQQPKPALEQKPLQKPLVKKALSIAEKRALKVHALQAASRAYAIIKSPSASRLFQETNPVHIEFYKREFGRAIGALKKGTLSTREAEAVIGKTNAFLEKFGIK